MRLKPYPHREGKRVWLGNDELESVIGQAKNTEQTIAFLLAGRCGLRRCEIVQVTPADVVDTPTGTHMRVWEDVAKQEHYREPPISDRLVTYIDAHTDAAGIGPADPIVDVADKTVYRWVQRAAERLQAESGDRGWSFLDVHDLRRTWGTNLLEQGVLPSVVMDWGGWDDWETFRHHYLGEFSPEAIRRERGKVNYLEGPVSSNSESNHKEIAPPGTTPT
ncbi:site-specific integrase [Halostagnicola larsenii]|uniref:site-specific integrase n=1 Tax=Halostagnicola larsenii TaxID=353800 RepID=UPI000A05D6B7|nr:site-specific integrase [Halostagnicola larsenii]